MIKNIKLFIFFVQTFRTNHMNYIYTYKHVYLYIYTTLRNNINATHNLDFLSAFS